jgi:hypothetical protein
MHNWSSVDLLDLLRPNIPTTSPSISKLIPLNAQTPYGSACATDGETSRRSIGREETIFLRQVAYRYGEITVHINTLPCLKRVPSIYRGASPQRPELGENFLLPFSAFSVLGVSTFLGRCGRNSHRKICASRESFAQYSRPSANRA